MTALSSYSDPTLTPQKAAARLAALLPHADVWVGSNDASVNVAFYDAPDAQALLDTLSARTPADINSHADIVNPDMRDLHFCFYCHRDASWFASVLSLAQFRHTPL